MPDFTLAQSDFERQTSILSTLLEVVDVTAKQSAEDVILVQGTALPHIPQGGQNTMAASAVVLLAAHFEEYVRQQVEEYSTGIVGSYSDLTAEFRGKMLEAYWKAALGKLSRIRPKDDPTWNVTASTLLVSIGRYPVAEDPANFVGKLICEHENNMRWDTVIELTGRVGIKNLSGRMHKHAALRTLLNAQKSEEFLNALRARLKEFYDLRNEIVHNISQQSGIGLTIFLQWREFLVTFAAALSKALDTSFTDFTADVARSQARAAAVAAATAAATA